MQPTDGFPTVQDFESQDHQPSSSVPSLGKAGKYSYARLPPVRGRYKSATQESSRGAVTINGTTKHKVAGTDWSAYTLPAASTTDVIPCASAAYSATLSAVAASSGPDGLDIPVVPIDGNFTAGTHGSGKRKADDTDEVDPCHSHSHQPKHSQSSGLMSNSSKGSSTTGTQSNIEDDETPATSRRRYTKADKDVLGLSPNPSNGGGGGGGCVQLRKAYRKTKRLPSSPLGLEETEDHKRARIGHNQVEKHYRNRLNVQLERLLSSLPSPLTDDDHDRRLSKAEVLDKARRRIKALESECEALKSECEALKQQCS
ncbi:helix-loop-helix DNA-binding domain containing protein [Zalerion maritima]|uniref:Helix-loop-helix DNA-binding domain containing protein n=1 Tax=Zalerion maritima TaxID=339359 RepID=A0AAD5RKW6_9PEZI|nr:helix-loop-helix DNA-binding domain containing protein [Zalerion maritima]